MNGRGGADGVCERRSLIVRNIEDPYFRKHFRMSKAVFQRLVEAVGRERSANGTLERNRTDVQEATLMGLWQFYNKDTFRSAGLNFDKDMSVAYHHYKVLLNAICGMGKNYIKWPTANGRSRTAAYYERYFGFPGVVGSIDGTLIPITAPPEQKQRYVDRHHDYSINVMLVADHRRMIIDAYIGQPGSVNDARVFRRSPLAKCLHGGNELLLPNEHLLGDGGYVLTPKIIVPYRDIGNLTRSHRNFNHTLSQCRSTIERTNGLLKSRMRRLEKLYCKSVIVAVKHIAASTVLHNFILLDGEEQDGIVLEGLPPEVNVYEAIQADREAGIQKRELLRAHLDDSDDEAEE